MQFRTPVALNISEWMLFSSRGYKNAPQLASYFSHLIPQPIFYILSIIKGEKVLVRFSLIKSYNDGTGMLIFADNYVDKQIIVYDTIWSKHAYIFIANRIKEFYEI